MTIKELQRDRLIEKPAKLFFSKLPFQIIKIMRMDMAIHCAENQQD